MSKRKTFDQEVLFSDKFNSLPAKERWLYIALNYYADDDGFVGSPQYILNANRCTKKSLQLLAERGYLIVFESGVVLITHWHIHNRVFKNDRYHRTVFEKERSLVEIDHQKVYYLKQEEKTSEHTGVSQPDCKQTNADPGNISFRG